MDVPNKGVDRSVASRRRTPAMVLAAASIVVICIVVWTQRVRSQADPEAAKRTGRPVPVRTAVVAEGSHESVIGATGVTEAAQTAVILAGGGPGLGDRLVTVTSVHIVEGQPVDRGELLFEFDDGLFALAVARQASVVASTRLRLAAIERSLQDGEETEPEVSVARLALTLAEHDLRLAEKELAWCQVRSPIQGVADVVAPAPGAQLPTGAQLVRILQLDPIHVRIDFPQERIDDVFIGQEAEVVLDSFPQDTFSGRVVRISPQVRTPLRVLPVVLEIANPDRRIKAGITGFARLIVRSEALTIPSSAVIDRGGQAMVFRVDDGRARIQTIRIGALVEIGTVEVMAGLHAGDEVVIFNKELLEDNDPVDVDWRKWARRE